MSGQVTVTVTTLPGRGGGEKSTQAVSEQTGEGQQVAVNLGKKRVIIHLEEGSTSVCHSPGSAKLSPAPAGEEKRVKQLAVVWRTRLSVFTIKYNRLFHQEKTGTLLCVFPKFMRHHWKCHRYDNLLPFLEKKRYFNHCVEYLLFQTLGYFYTGGTFCRCVVV